VAQRVAQARAQRERLEARIRSLQRVLADEAVVARAGRRLPLATEVVRRREDRVLALRDAVQDLARRRDAVAGSGSGWHRSSARRGRPRSRRRT
jgi:exonuclease SbcC